MRKRLLIVLLAVGVLSLLLVPLPTKAENGTRAYTALTYTVVRWNRAAGDGTYEKTRIYPFPQNFKSLDDLWKKEKVHAVPIQKCNAVIVEISGTSVLAQPLEGEPERRVSDRIAFDLKTLSGVNIKVGDTVELTYVGEIAETYPARIAAVTACVPATNLRSTDYTGVWLDDDAETPENDLFADITITKIYKNCFFANTVIPTPYEIKLNGTLSEDWCVGDQVICTYQNARFDPQSGHVEADMLTVAASDFQLDPNACYKPVIYLYPEKRQEVSVKLALDGNFTCTYPAYQNGWLVTASPDGTLTDKSGQTYSYLYWEGETDAAFDLSKGFCVKGADTAAFLEQALSSLGLTRREANEFIVYWLPLMQDNPYNLISFQTAAYTDAAKLEISPTPDTLIRVFMAWKPSDTFVTLPSQTLTAPARSGFTVVEWGGTKLP